MVVAEAFRLQTMSKGYSVVQVEAELAAVNGKFLQLHGPAGGAQLDLYGRAAMQPVAPPDAGASKASSFRDGKSMSQTARIRSASVLQSQWLLNHIEQNVAQRRRSL